MEAISDGDSHYDRGEIRYYLAADESILFFAVEDLYPNTSSSDEYDSNDDYFSDDYADAMYAASEVDRNLESVFDHIDNYGRK